MDQVLPGLRDALGDELCAGRTTTSPSSLVGGAAEPARRGTREVCGVTQDRNRLAARPARDLRDGPLPVTGDVPVRALPA